MYVVHFSTVLPDFNQNVYLEEPYPFPMNEPTLITISSYPERLFKWIPLPVWLSILISWELLFALDYVLGINLPQGNDHSLEFGFLVLFFALISTAIVYCSQLLKNLYSDLLLFIDEEDAVLKQWYESRLNRSYTGLGPLLFGLGFMLLENFTVGPMIRQFSPAGTSLYYFRYAYELLGFFTLGMGVWALFNVLFIPIQLTHYKIRVSINQISGRGLQALGSVFFRMSLFITLTFIPLVAAAVFSPLSENYIILLWLLAGGMLIFAFFLFPQMGVHKIMAYEKRQRLMAFSGHLEEAMERSLKDPTSENMQQLRELFELQAHLKNMNEWPFNVNMLWQLLTALLIPILLAVLEIFF